METLQREQLSKALHEKLHGNNFQERLKQKEMLGVPLPETDSGSEYTGELRDYEVSPNKTPWYVKIVKYFQQKAYRRQPKSNQPIRRKVRISKEMAREMFS